MYSFSTRILNTAREKICLNWPTDTSMYCNSLFLQNIIEIKRSLQKKFSEDMLFNVKNVVEIFADLP